MAKLSALVLASPVLVATAASAQPMSGDALKQTVNGKSIYLVIPFGGEFPLRYRSNGLVEGKSPDSFLARLDPKSDTGHWWIEGNMLCQKWSIWYDRKQYCFTLESAGPKALNWVRNDGLSGKARIGD